MSVIFREAYSDTSINMGHLRHECVSEMASLESFFENSFEKSVSEFYGHHNIIFIFSPVARQCCWAEGAEPLLDLACTSHFPGNKKNR